MVWKHLNNNNKKNSDRCDIFTSGHKAEQVSSEIGEHKIWETKTEKLVGSY